MTSFMDDPLIIYYLNKIWWEEIPDQVKKCVHGGYVSRFSNLDRKRWYILFIRKYFSLSFKRYSLLLSLSKYSLKANCNQCS